ncbi:protein tyrosine phosphatase family protein [Thiolapillus brandeum]|uniref:DSP-PTPase phosphatase fused to NAD+ Kinase domain-containing protein n=1 Tax=Thiolapillus brandeum TaxID=1076588 RepID=A0A7U6JIP2_9GAMM|nr:sulfur transferase domain-containing protein [Thiolapillus brandeum]BAO45082.1 conserved hypothetical protein [Thiolapillus brandeum]
MMGYRHGLRWAALLIFCLPAWLQAAEVQVIQGHKDLFRHGQVYIGGQPSIETLEWLKSQGVKRIINLRTADEMREHAETGYDESAWADRLGLEYAAVPVNGLEGYTRENLERFMMLMKPGGQVLVHCATARRANDFYMAWLIESGRATVEQAIAIGRRIRFLVPLENLLGHPLLITGGSQ